MNRRIVLAVSLTAILALAAVGVIASGPISLQAFSRDANDLPPQAGASDMKADVNTPQQMGQSEGLEYLQATDSEQEEDSDKAATKPYIGVAVSEVEGSGVVVTQVLPDGPSAGLLQQNDNITAVDGEPIDSIDGLVAAIAEAGAGATLNLTIVRGGQTLDVNITVGERAVPQIRRWTFKSGQLPGFNSGAINPFHGFGDGFVSSETVVEDEDGNFRTYRTVVGKVSNIDVAAGTFTLTPKGGHAPIDYTISDETRVITSQYGDLGGLNTKDPTIVMDVDGDVKIVKQVDEPMSGRWGRGWKHYPGGKRDGFGHGRKGRIFTFPSMDEYTGQMPRELAELLERLFSEHGLEMPDDDASSGNSSASGF